MDCPSLATCLFFNDKMAELSALADMMKKKYCRTDQSQCARAIVSKSLGKDKVPTDMFPNQVERAMAMVKSI